MVISLEENRVRGSGVKVKVKVKVTVTREKGYRIRGKGVEKGIFPILSSLLVGDPHKNDERVV